MLFRSLQCELFTWSSNYVDKCCDIFLVNEDLVRIVRNGPIFSKLTLYLLILIQALKYLFI